MKPVPLLTAHTGCMGAPDNSLFSIETAIQHEADLIEEDILITSDGVLVLSHDDLVHLADGTEVRISKTSYAELCRLDIQVHHGSSDETIRILSLESVLPIVQASGKMMNLDIKSDACVEPVSRLIEGHGLVEHVILSGCQKKRAHLVNNINPQLRKLLNVDTSLFDTNPYTTAAQISCEDAKSANCFGLNINYRYVRPELLQLAASYGLAVYIWTVNEKEDMRHFMEMGVQSITSRNIAALVKVKQERLTEI
ncbi:Glycerophosphoryl diester phosphodiesterase [compost metagenome]